MKNIKFNRWEMLLGWLRQDIWRKLLALMLSLLLYIAISGRLNDHNKRTIKSVPVELELPGNLVRCSDVPLTADVTVSGNSARINELDPARLRIHSQISLKNFTSGEPYRLTLRNKDVSGVGFGVQVVGIDPGELILNLEPMITKKVPIRARFNSLSMLSLDYAITDTRFAPNEVLLSGPESMLESIHEIYTMPIPIDAQVTESFEYRSSLRLPEGVKSDRKQIDVQVTVEKALTERKFYSVPLSVLRSPTGQQDLTIKDITPTAITVTVRGPKGELAMMSSSDVKALVDIDKINAPGAYQVSIKVVLEKLHPGVSVKDFQPATVELNLEKK